MGILTVENNRCGERWFAVKVTSLGRQEYRYWPKQKHKIIWEVSAETRMEQYFCRPVRKYVAKEHKGIH